MKSPRFYVFALCVSLTGCSSYPPHKSPYPRAAVNETYVPSAQEQAAHQALDQALLDYQEDQKRKVLKAEEQENYLIKHSGTLADAFLNIQPGQPIASLDKNFNFLCDTRVAFYSGPCFANSTRKTWLGETGRIAILAVNGIVSEVLVSYSGTGKAAIHVLTKLFGAPETGKNFFVTGPKTEESPIYAWRMGHLKYFVSQSENYYVLIAKWVF